MWNFQVKCAEVFCSTVAASVGIISFFYSNLFRLPAYLLEPAPPVATSVGIIFGSPLVRQEDPGPCGISFVCWSPVCCLFCLLVTSVEFVFGRICMAPPPAGDVFSVNTKWCLVCPITHLHWLWRLAACLNLDCYVAIYVNAFAEIFTSFTLILFG